MLHHLDSNPKVPALREVCRVLKPGGSLHLADFDAGDHARGLHGFLASLLHARHARVVRSKVLDLMQDAGLAHSQEVARHASVMGPIVYYRAVRSPSPTPAAA